MKSLLLATAMTLAVIGNAQAITLRYTGSAELLERCIDQNEDTHDGSVGYCSGFITGVIDMTSDKLCLPKRTTTEQVSDLVVMYLRKHPELRQYAAAWTVETALKQAFPCLR
jgi:hypothetical protein